MATKKLSPNTVVKKAQEEIGYLEKKSNSQLDDKTANAGSGNYTKYWRDTYPSLQGQAWCLCFDVNCFEVAYGKEVAKQMLCMDKSGLTFYTPTAAQNFKDAKRWYTTPEVGDIIFFKNSQRIHHVGIVYRVSSTKVYTIEGNTNSGTAVVANGGGVWSKEYALNNTSIAGYGRPRYTVTTTTQTLNEINVSSDRRGLKIVGASSLNVRKSPVNGKVVKTYAQNTYHIVTAKVKASDNNWWFKTSDGYICGNYVEGWLKELNNRWWYVKKGYTYDTLKICSIDGADYGFDREGYLITSDRINSDGQII